MLVPQVPALPVNFWILAKLPGKVESAELDLPGRVNSRSQIKHLPEMPAPKVPGLPVKLRSLGKDKRGCWHPRCQPSRLSCDFWAKVTGDAGIPGASPPGGVEFEVPDQAFTGDAGTQVPALPVKLRFLGQGYRRCWYLRYQPSRLSCDFWAKISGDAGTPGASPPG